MNMWDDDDDEEEEDQGPKGLEDVKQYDVVYYDLMQECKHSAPGARLSARLRSALEKLRPDERRTLCSRTTDGCAPLFVACRRGNVELVEYLVHVCAADLEQRGVYEVPHDQSTHSVTPLWCAAVSGRFEVLRTLVDAGADLNASSDSGSTPVRSACFMTHLDVVRLLVARGADIHQPNFNGGTCLINSVQSVPLCKFLLQHGANVDARDMQLKTALHYAIQEHRLETTRLLLDHRASPHLTAASGDDALRTACLKGASQIVQLLVSRVLYPRECVADAYELLGATQIDEFNDLFGAIASWRQATAIRHKEDGYLEKRNHMGDVTWDLGDGAVALGYTYEWRTFDELESLSADMDAMRMQALLVAARVLGTGHKDTVFRLMYRGASYADAYRYQRCVELWTWALQIRTEKDSLLYSDTCQTACALTRLLLDARVGRLERAEGLPCVDDVLRVLRMLTNNLITCRKILRKRPVHRRQADNFDCAVRCLSHLLHLLTDHLKNPEAMAAVRQLIEDDIRTIHTGDSLMHLCVSGTNSVRSTYFADDNALDVFPSLDAVSLLLRCGADPHSRNESNNTPLHLCTLPYNYYPEMVQLLLNAGAHMDTPNRDGDIPADMLTLHRERSFRPLEHIRLTCLAARQLVLAYNKPLPAHLLPAELHTFLKLHSA